MRRNVSGGFSNDVPTPQSFKEQFRNEKQQNNQNPYQENTLGQQGAQQGGPQIKVQGRGQGRGQGIEQQQGRTSYGSGPTPYTKLNPSGRLVSPRAGIEFGLKQSGIAKNMLDSRNFLNPPATSINAADNNPRASLPNLDDINDNFFNSGVANTDYNSRRRYVDYNTYYATTEAKKNELRERYKRTKLRKKKSSGLIDNIDIDYGSSILDSYKNLGSRR